MAQRYSFFAGAAQQPQIAVAAQTQEGATVTEGRDVTEGMPVFAPCGVSFVPAEGERLLLLPFEDYYVCVGALTAPDGLLAGELRLRSAGGAYLTLKNSGEVEINGLVVGADGRIAQAAGPD